MAEESPQKLEFLDVSSASASSSPAPAAPEVNPSVSTENNATAQETLLGNAAGTIRQAKHPVASFFHLLFKILAIVVYMLANMFSGSYVFIFVVCILLLAFDFWTVKNVTGRLLVGLRWWNKIQTTTSENEITTSSNEWIFESLDDMSEIGKNDSIIFWYGLYLPALVWALFAIVSIIKLSLEWFVIDCVALTLTGANIIGYTKCQKDAQAKMNQFVQSSAFSVLSSNAGSSLLSKVTGLAFGSSSSSSSSSNIIV